MLQENAWHCTFKIGSQMLGEFLLRQKSQAVGTRQECQQGQCQLECLTWLVVSVESKNLESTSGNPGLLSRLPPRKIIVSLKRVEKVLQYPKALGYPGVTQMWKNPHLQIIFLKVLTTSIFDIFVDPRVLARFTSCHHQPVSPMAHPGPFEATCPGRRGNFFSALPSASPRC